jgi:hypothetical protein
LANQVRRGAGVQVDFTEVAPFAWDRVFVVRPYTPTSDIHARLGFWWHGATWSAIDAYDSFNLVVFVRNGAVVCWFDHPRNEGDLLELENPKGYSREEAKFWVRLGEDQRFMLSK